jgi:hypothetical protein
MVADSSSDTAHLRSGNSHAVAAVCASGPATLQMGQGLCEESVASTLTTLSCWTGFAYQRRTLAGRPTKCLYTRAKVIDMAFFIEGM